MIPINDITQRFAERALFITSDGPVSYAEFGGMVKALEKDGSASDWARNLIWSPESFAGFLHSLATRPATALCPLPDGTDLTDFLPYQPLLIIQSGGSTGSPKHVVHSVDRLLSRYRILDTSTQRILVLYEADHIAGLDAFFQAFHRGSSLVIADGRDAHSVVRSIEEHQVEVLPATPTFLQFLLLSGAMEGKSLASIKAIPHGAEPMPPALRNRIQEDFPKARLIHRFGLSELGALPVREDPMDPSALFLDADDCRWKLDKGELLIQTPTRMLGTLEGGLLDPAASWYRTGDIAELTSTGAMRVLGRREAMINVGGNKILPETVEQFLLEQDGVLDVTVYGEPSALTGQAVVADVVFNCEPMAAIWLRSLRKIALQKGLSLAHVPTRIIPVDHIEKTNTGKRLRRIGKA